MNARWIAIGAVGLLGVVTAWMLLRPADTSPLLETRRAVVVEPPVAPLRQAPPKIGEKPKGDRATHAGPGASPGQHVNVHPTNASGSAAPDDDGLARSPAVANVDVTVWPANPQGIRGAVNEVIPAIQECYQAALEEVPDLDGKLSVAFEIHDVDGVGKVIQARPENDQLQDGPTSDCVLDAMEALQFDVPADGGVMAVTYPFEFRRTLDE